MPLILERNYVSDLYSEAAERQWVLPTFNSENLTTSEAILQATKKHGQSMGINNLPVIIGITNKYPPRSQSVYYTHTRQWQLGMRLFLSDLKVLTSRESPFGLLRVMIHLDHICWNEDEELQTWNFNQFSSIMYDASTLPFEQNIKKTADFVEKNGKLIFIEGACDETPEATNALSYDLTTPEMAENFYHKTGVDILVANLGTEHRARSTNLSYHGKVARDITGRIGPRLCLHGTSSVPPEQIKNLFSDGIRKVNIWTTLERDSSPALFSEMLVNAAKIIGPHAAKELISKQVLGVKADSESQISVNYYTTAFRQQIVYQRMLDIIRQYLGLWYK